MDLKQFLPKANKKEDEEFYWALIIEPGWVQAGIWKITDQKAEVVFTSQPVAWEEDSELVNSSDAVLSAAIQNFPEDFTEPNKTVFGVSYGWIKDGEIAPEYLDKIKKICTELSLSPVGFVVMAEAITHLTKSETGVPSNSIVLGIYKQNLELSLFENGKLAGTTQIARSVSLAEDVVEGLSRLSTGEALPSNILVYDGREGDLEDARQDLLKVDWEDYKDLNFLHSPKVEVINSERKVFAVCLAGASELAGVTSLVAKTFPEAPAEVPVVLKDIDNEPKEVEMDESESMAASDMGFEVTGANVDSVDTKDANLGLDEGSKLTSEEDLGKMESNFSEVNEEAKEAEKPKKSLKIPSIGSGLAGIKGKFPKLNLKMPKSNGAGKPFVWGVGFLLIIILLAGVFWWFVPKATVTIFLSPRKLEENVNLSVDTSVSSPNFDQKIVPGQMVSTSVSGEKTVDTTGTKVVGDKATGEVTIYRVGPQISLAAGTLINGPESLKFSIENSVTVASGSASTPGETKIAVTAQDIGAQYNLASGTTFSVGNYSTSDMEAKNEASFSGGSSREIQAVSKEDQASLEKELAQELIDKAQDELDSSVSEGDLLIKESIDSSNVTADFNHKVGDEATSLKLSLNVSVSAIVVGKDDLATISEAILKDKVSSGFVLNSDQLNYSFGDIEKKDENYSLNLKIVANLLPDVNVDDVKEKIKGRQVQIAKDYLQTGIPAFTRVEMKIKPSFPGKLKTLPHVDKNIDIQLSADR